MIHVLTIEKIRGQLAHLPSLLERYQRGDLDFPDITVAWLETVEKELGNLRLTELSELAILRGRVLKAAEETGLADSPIGGKRAHQRARRNTAAVESADRAESILRNRIQQSETRLQAFEDKLCEGLTAFLLENPLTGDAGPSSESQLRNLWQSLAQYAPTRPLIIYLSVALASTDRFYLLGQVMRRMNNN